MTEQATETEYAIPEGDTGHEPGTFLMVLTALKPFKLYETRNGWTTEPPTDGSLIQTYDKIEWVFADDEGEIGTGRTSIARSERSTLFAWATGLGLPPSVVLDRSKAIPASQLIGREAMVTFAPNKRGYNEIVNVVPPPRQRTAASAPAAAAPASAVPPQVAAEIVPPQPAAAPAEVPGTALPNMVAPNPSPAPAAVPQPVAATGDGDLPF